MAHTDIAPPSTRGAAAEAGDLFEALRPSLSTRVDAAVRQGKAAHPLRVPPAPRAEQLELHVLEDVAAGTEAGSAKTADGAAGDAPGDWASMVREEKLQPTPPAFSASVDQHEIPAELGGSDGTADAAAGELPAEPAVDPTATTPPASSLPPHAFEGTPVERLPRDVLARGAAGRGDHAEGTACDEEEAAAGSCVGVSWSATSQRHTIAVQMRHPPASAMACVRAVAEALDAVEARCNAVLAELDAAEAGADAAAAPAIVVTWSALPHCAFFSAAASPAALPLAQRQAYAAAKEAVVWRFHALTARLARRARFVAVAGSGAVLDFGAEVFFACGERRLTLPLSATRTRELDGAAAASLLPTRSVTAVGFPSCRVGFFPSTATLVALQRLCGSLHTVKWVPALHTYDAASLADVGLLRLVDSGADALRGSRSEVGATTGATRQWARKLEDFALRRVCQTADQRRWVMETLLWSREFSEARHRRELGGDLTAEMADGWYDYAVEALCRNTPPPRPADHSADAAESDSAADLRPLLATPPYRGAAHAVRTYAGAMRRPLPPLPHHRFLAFPHSQRALWAEKMRTLAATPESAGAAVLLDCSDAAVMDTLDLVEAHLVRTAVQQARLPYLNFVLVGEAAAAQSVLARVPCAAVVSPAAAFCEVGRASAQQVRLFATPQWPTDLQQDTLVAALTYVQQRRTPHVVAAGAAPQRLLLALLGEAVALAQTLPAAGEIEAAATSQLRLRLGPFQLVDTYSTTAIAGMAAEERLRTTAASAALAPAPVALLESCTRSMAREGLLGARGIRGGFYGPAVAPTAPGSAAPALLREGVLGAFVRRHATPALISDRLRAAVLNAACDLLVRGEVQHVDDIDLLSMSALGWREETGGVLYQVDQLGEEGLPRLVAHMADLAVSGAAPHLSPHPLLLRMVEQKVRFANLATSGLL